MSYRFEQDKPEVGRLREIQQEMLDLLGEAEEIVMRHADTMTAARAKSYWIPHIKCALIKEHEYLGSSMHDMDDTIKEMVESAGKNNNDEDEYDDSDDSED